MTTSAEQIPPTQPPPPRQPLWTWIMLFCSVVGVSSAGAIFQEVDDVPPLLRASWRLQTTSIVLCPLAVWQWITCDQTIKDRCFERRSLIILALSSFAVAVHFGSWVMSLDMTTLTHALLFVTCHPLLIVIGMYFLHNLPTNIVACTQQKYGLGQIRKPNSYEYVGVVVGFIGASVTLLDVGGRQERHTVTIGGDAMAFLGAVMFILYQVCGRVLREWMPLFLYAFPVTFLGSLLLLAASLIEHNPVQFNPCGWASMEYIWWFVALSLASGILGHTGFNACLAYMSPLIVCSSTMLEPVFGSAIGFFIFGTAWPGNWTLAGGMLLICGFLLTTYGGSRADVLGMRDKTNVTSQNDKPAASLERQRGEEGKEGEGDIDMLGGKTATHEYSLVAVDVDVNTM